MEAAVSKRAKAPKASPLEAKVEGVTGAGTNAEALAPQSPPLPPPGSRLATVTLLGGREISAHGLGTLALAVRYPDPGKRPTHAAAIAVIHAAIDAGARLVDTGDTYCDGPDDLHSGEQLVAEVRTWLGNCSPCPVSPVQVQYPEFGPTTFCVGVLSNLLQASSRGADSTSYPVSHGHNTRSASAVYAPSC